MEKPKKTPGTGRGTGRRPGSKNKLTMQTKQNIAEFFRSCTSENVRWRQNMRRKLEMAAASQEFINLSRLALSYAHGLPIKMQDTTTKRDSLVFVTTNGLYPWDSRADSMKEITDAMIAGKEEEEKLKALEAAKPEVIDVKADKADSEVPETLEIVQEPPEQFSTGRAGPGHRAQRGAVGEEPLEVGGFEITRGHDSQEIRQAVDRGRRAATTLLQWLDVGVSPEAAIRELAPTLNGVERHGGGLAP